MHPTIDELLAFRDDEADPATASHVEGCPRCLDRLDELLAVTRGLRELGELRPTSDPWPGIRRSILRRRRAGIARLAAAAAVLTAAVALGTLVLGPHASPEPGQEAAATTGATDEIALVTAELVATSRELELILERRARRPRVVSARRAAAVALLEDRLAVVDAAIATSSYSAEPEPTAGLWLHRVELLDALVEVTGPTPATSDVQHAILGY